MFSFSFRRSMPAAMRFVAVGASAALVHYLVVVALVESMQWPVLLANIMAFLVAFCVSFSGHAYFTFSRSKRSVRESLPRFFITASCAFIVNEMLLYFLLSLGWPYQISLILVLLLVAAGTYLVSKYWAFR